MTKASSGLYGNYHTGWYPEGTWFDSCLGCHIS
jgi:hypothetical protein